MKLRGQFIRFADSPDNVNWFHPMRRARNFHIHTDDPFQKALFESSLELKTTAWKEERKKKFSVGTAEKMSDSLPSQCIHSYLLLL